MQICAPISLKAALKSFTEVVLPAVDPNNKMAQEQAELIVGLLTLIADRLPLEYQYNLDELRRLMRLATELLEIDSSDRDLGTQVKLAGDVLFRAKADPQEVVDSISALNSAVGIRAHEIAQSRETDDRRSARLVLEASREQQLRERSWLLAQGWEIDPSSVPPIEVLLSADVIEEKL